MKSVLSALLVAGLAASGVRGEIRFREISAGWGLDFEHRHGGTGELFMIETVGSGVVLFDYDFDGDDDLLFIDSGDLPNTAEPVSGSVLYRNDGDGRFVDVTRRAGLAPRCYGMGGTAADVDDDGDPDIYLTCFGANRLLSNDGDGTFTDVTAAAGVGDTLWGASTSFADTDRDGDLDLYVTNYVDFTFDNNPPCGVKESGLRSYCHPDVYDGLPDRFFRNRGDGTFVDATAEAGFASAAGKGLGVLFADLNDDGWPDLYVANDMTANFLFVNQRDGTFTESALMSGTAFGERGEPEAGMGIAIGDIDGNGRPDIVVTHLDQQTNAVYSNMGSGVFVDRRFPAKLAEASYYNVGFGVVLADLDNDGDLDLAVANGHILHNAEAWGTGSTYKQPNQLFENLGDGRFREVADAGLAVVRSSRGAAAGDLDGDGDLDLVVTNSNDRAEVYENVSSAGGGWLRVQLAESGGAPSIGGRARLATSSGAQARQVATASSYMSQGSTDLHFGLGSSPRVDELRVTWADGAERVLKGLPAGWRVWVGR